MTAPRLEIDLEKIFHNARTLVERLASRGISVTGVTKATLGSPEILGELLRAGVGGLGDSRIENIEVMRRVASGVSMTLIRSPMLSQVDRVVEGVDVSFNTELDVIRKLSFAAQKRNLIHGVVIMVELGDLREGVMPDDLEAMVREVLRLPGIVLKGLGTNMACRSGTSPDSRNMAELSRLANAIEASFDIKLEIISGGNSANLQWAFSGSNIGRINNLRLGESILLGCDPLSREQIDGLHVDAINLVAETIESKVKPSQPWGELGQTAFGEKISTSSDRGDIIQTILAIGHQDTDPLGLQPPPTLKILGASSDHLIIDCGKSCVPIGTEFTFQLNYSALIRCMTSPLVSKVTKQSLLPQ